MSAGAPDSGTHGPALLCYDGSADAASAVARAGALLGGKAGIVLTVVEPLATWDPYDPATILSAPVSKLASRALDLDGIALELAQETVGRGVSLAQGAGFAAEARTARGKPWRVICDVAEEINAPVIVLGARGLSRIQSVLLGSVSSAVAVHAARPVLIVPSAGPEGD